ncbi:hypothetical protein PFX98_16300 [Paucibacter sediminis]|uniref:Uncharacterized protein n=1 Tax=Paucibacter sediminis TaxID=3019553 RepID=A0AA95NJ39_9BURK|nr:hypothetical protein [Paucibacter sp. S2-9]WIT10466.1 hypothetical protein PFX98_16300 [Paucibacter sp. S2-9]
MNYALQFMIMPLTDEQRPIAETVARELLDTEFGSPGEVAQALLAYEAAGGIQPYGTPNPPSVKRWLDAIANAYIAGWQAVGYPWPIPEDAWELEELCRDAYLDVHVVS